MVIGYKLPVLGEVPDTDPQKKVIVEFRDAYQKRFGKEPNPYGALVYDAFTALVSVIHAVGPDREKVRDALTAVGE